MDQAFFTKKELAERWKCSTTAVDDMVKSGVLTPCRNLPGWKARASDVYRLEETKLDPMSPLERTRLEREIRRLTEENNRLKSSMYDVAAIAIEVTRGVLQNDAGSSKAG